jgi:hypothetical protein
MMAQTHNPPLQGEVAARSADGGVSPAAVTPLRFATLSTSPCRGGLFSCVTPAKAGVQAWYQAARHVIRIWTPAFAGMTMLAILSACNQQPQRAQTQAVDKIQPNYSLFAANGNVYLLNESNGCVLVRKQVKDVFFWDKEYELDGDTAKPCTMTIDTLNAMLKTSG